MYLISFSLLDIVFLLSIQTGVPQKGIILLSFVENSQKNLPSQNLHNYDRKGSAKMAQYIEYLRKSQLDRDYEELTVEETLNRHRAILGDFIRSNKLNVTVVLEEVVSGESLPSRPKMLELLELVNTGEYDGVVCMDIDRLSRGSTRLR